MIGHLLTDYIQLGMNTLLYNTTLCFAIEFERIDVYIVCPQRIRQKNIESRSTNEQICACQNSVRHKGVLNSMLFPPVSPH